MAIQKLQARETVRVLADRTTLTSQQDPSPPTPQNKQPLLFSNTQSHGHMAPSFRRKNLVCFYCNKKSDIKYDGLISRWDCTQCESTNFLDENGEITDPPVATESAAPGLLKYTISQPNSQAFQDPGSELFCPTCVKNQHLYTASLAQYHVETDPNHPRYRELEREYFTYRRSLEKLYPQVCEDCEPKVLERMRDAGRTAKADHLRRAMDKSRARRLHKQRQLSFSGIVNIIGKCLWYTGLLGQLFWSMMALAVSIINRSWPQILTNDLNARILNILHPTHPMAWVSLFCSFASIWWNPRFKQMNKGFMSHISGFGNWYKLQTLSIAVRWIFHNTIGTGIFTDPFSSATLGANGFLGISTIMFAIMSRRSLKVDLTPLWTATPEKLSHVRPKATNSPRGLDSMADVLDQIVATPSRNSQQTLSSSSIAPPAFNLRLSEKSHRSNVASRFSITPQKPILGQERTGPSLLDMSETESFRYLATGEVPPRLQQQDNSYIGEEMEWTPTETPSQHRAFNSPQSLQRTSESFGQAPTIDQPSPFWYKVPPAPVTPAQKLRNPPNRPALRVASQEVKENFFNRVTQRLPVSDTAGRDSPPIRREDKQHAVEFAQQKFFPPPAPNEAGNTLADLLTGFSLGGSENESPAKQIQQRPWKGHILQSLTMVLGLSLWNHAVYHPSEYSQNAMLLVMTACVGISMRTVLNSITTGSIARYGPFSYLGAIIGGLETAAAVYGLIEVLAGRGYNSNCASHGTILIGEMLVHELWVAMVEI